MVNCVGVASQIWQGGWSNKWLAINRQKCHFTQQITITCVWSSFNSWYPRDIVLYFYSFINDTLVKSLKADSHCTRRAMRYNWKSYINHWHIIKVEMIPTFSLRKRHHWFIGTFGRKRVQCERAFISHLSLSNNVTCLCHSIILENCQHACSNLIGTPKLVLKAKFCIAVILDSSMPPPPPPPHTHTLKKHGLSTPLSGVWTVGRSLILCLILIVS